MGTKTIDELVRMWEQANLLYPLPCKAYRAGHLQGSKDSLELLKRAYDAIPSEEDPEDELDWPNIIDLLTDLEDQIGYIEENLKQQEGT